MSRLIDADALILKLKNAIEVGHRVDMPTNELEAVLDDVESMPTIEPEQKTGKWIQHFIKFPEGQIAYGFECSVCGKCIDINRYSKDGGYCFCPNCGAQMERGEQE